MSLTRALLLLPDARLRTPARRVRLPDRGIERLADELLATMRAANGIGLAAPQVGEPLRLAVVEFEGTLLTLANPELVTATGSQAAWEACLSVEHLVGWVDRPLEVVVAAQDLRGTRRRYRRSGLVARALVHEIDHLAGRLYIDDLAPERLVDTRVHPTPPVGPPGRGPTPSRQGTR